MRIKCLRAFILIALVLAGCGGVVLREDAQGQTREVYVGTTFSISLPVSSQNRQPEIKDPIIRFLGRQADLDGRDVFEFKAVGLGDTDIRLSSVPGRESPGDFWVHVRVKSASDDSGVPMHRW